MYHIEFTDKSDRVPLDFLVGTKAELSNFLLILADAGCKRIHVWCRGSEVNQDTLKIIVGTPEPPKVFHCRVLATLKKSWPVDSAGFQHDYVCRVCGNEVLVMTAV